MSATTPADSSRVPNYEARPSISQGVRGTEFSREVTIGDKTYKTRIFVSAKEEKKLEKSGELQTHLDSTIEKLKSKAKIWQELDKDVTTIELYSKKDKQIKINPQQKASKFQGLEKREYQVRRLSRELGMSHLGNKVSRAISNVNDLGNEILYKIKGGKATIELSTAPPRPAQRGEHRSSEEIASEVSADDTVTAPPAAPSQQGEVPVPPSDQPSSTQTPTRKAKFPRGKPPEFKRQETAAAPAPKTGRPLPAPGSVTHAPPPSYEEAGGDETREAYLPPSPHRSVQLPNPPLPPTPPSRGSASPPPAPPPSPTTSRAASATPTENFMSQIQSGRVLRSSSEERAAQDLSELTPEQIKKIPKEDFAKRFRSLSKEKFELLTKEQLKAITEEQLSTLNQAEQLSITVNIRFYGAKGKKDDTSEGEASQGDESEWI